MKLKVDNFNRLMNDEKFLSELIEFTKQNYRPLDPGQYLYNLLTNLRKDIFSDEYLELVYTTLIAWNMNGRGAKLQGIEEFKKSIRENRTEIESLLNYRLEKINESELSKILEILNKLFHKLKIVKTKSPLVTFSKTMHFLLPHLAVPVDRSYTIDFFYGHKNIPSEEKQFKIYSEIFLKFWEIGKKYDLSRYLDEKWNRNIPKIIDNAIIGFKKFSKK